MSMYTTDKHFTKKTSVSNIKKGCLQCEGDLVAHDEIYTFKLFGKKLFSLGRKRPHVYVCDDCEHTYLPSVRYHSFLNSEERKARVNSNNDIYARLMVASLAYTADVDGNLSRKEDQLLERVMKEAAEFPSAKVVLEKVLDLGIEAGDYVFSVFEFATQHLSREQLESVIIANARMVLVDGRIKKSEEKLLRKYMKASGVNESLDWILAKAHKEQYEGGVSQVTKHSS